MSNSSRRLLELVLSVAGPILVVGLWELLSRTNTIDSRFWPAPSTLWETAGTLIEDGTLQDATLITLRRIIYGFALGAIPGIIIGLAMGLFWPIRSLLSPLATIIYAIPKIAVLPLAFIVFGIGESSKLFIVAISIVFLVAVSTMSGVLELDKVYGDVARNLGASRFQLFRTVALPGALPSIFTGLRLALGLALVVVVGTEFVRAKDGLGQFIWFAYTSRLAFDEMHVGIITTGVLGLALTTALNLLEAMLIPSRRAATSRFRWQAWYKAVRPNSFTTSTIPVIAASMLAFVEDDVNWGYFVLMLLASMLTHAACNLTNDYFDAINGVDSANTLGQGGALQSGDLSFDDFRLGITFCFGAAFVLALPIIADVGAPILWIALFSAAAAFFYTGGPFPLAYFGLGELTVFLAMGVGMVIGTYYVHTGEVTTNAALLSVAMGLLAAGFLHANNVRDIETDRANGKRTLANLLPRIAATREFALLEILPFLIALAMIVVQPKLFAVAATIILLPRVWVLIRTIATEREAKTLNPVVRKAAGIHLGFGTIVSLALLITGLVTS